MPRIIKQTLVEQDLIEIWLYTFKEWGEQQADMQKAGRTYRDS